MQPGTRQDHQTRYDTNIFFLFCPFMFLSIHSLFCLSILSCLISFILLFVFFPVNDTTLFTLGDGKFQTFFFLFNMSIQIWKL